jgi:hypothetical protein
LSTGFNRSEDRKLQALSIGLRFSQLKIIKPASTLMYFGDCSEKSRNGAANASADWLRQDYWNK